MFKSRPEHYTRNLLEGQQINAQPATMTGHDGAEPAVGIFQDRQIRYVIPVSEALRIATEIADAISAHRTQEEITP